MAEWWSIVLFDGGIPEPGEEQVADLTRAELSGGPAGVSLTAG
ncbi:MAG TPA: hypothetical protein VIP48_00120 [Streptosporangiaceae bacterium]